MKPRFVALVAAALCAGSLLASGTPVRADDPTPPPAPAPTPIVLPTLPPQRTLDPYVRTAIDLLTGIVNRRIANDQNSANGQVTYFKRFDLQVQTGTNAYRNVHLHQGTVINPRGASLAPGERVSVGGAGQPDGSLAADVITILQ